MSDSAQLAQILEALKALQQGQDVIADRQHAESLSAGEAERRLDARMEALADAQNALRHDFLTELDKTRSALMERLQLIRDDVTVNLATAQIADKAARSAIDQGREVTDLLYALTRLRHLQETVEKLQGEGGQQ